MEASKEQGIKLALFLKKSVDKQSYVCYYNYRKREIQQTNKER